MTFSKKRISEFDDYNEIRRKRLSSDELRAQDKAIDLEVAALHAMQESISVELAKFMAKEGIGINELTRRLNTSSRQTSRIMKGEANVTLATLAEVAAIMGTTPKITFEKS